MENVVKKLMDVCRKMKEPSLDDIYEKIYEPFFSRLEKEGIRDLVTEWTAKIVEEKGRKRENCEIAVEGLFPVLFSERPEVHPIPGIPVEFQEHIFLEEAVEEHPDIPEDVIKKYMESKYGKYASLIDVISVGRLGMAVINYIASSLILSNLFYASPRKMERMVLLIGRFNEKEDKVELKEESLKKSLLFLMKLLASYNVSEKLPRPVTKVERELFKFFNTILKTGKVKDIIETSVVEMVVGTTYDDILGRLEKFYQKKVKETGDILDYLLTVGLSNVSMDFLVKETDGVLLGGTLSVLYALVLAAALKEGIGEKEEEVLSSIREEILDFLYEWLVGYPFISVLEEEKRGILEDLIDYAEKWEEGEESERKEIALACYYNMKDYDKVLTIYSKDLKGADVHPFTEARVILAKLNMGEISKEKAIKELEELQKRLEKEGYDSEASTMKEAILYLKGILYDYIEMREKRIENVPINIDRETREELEKEEVEEIKEKAVELMKQKFVIDPIVLPLLALFPDDRKLLEKLRRE